MISTINPSFFLFLSFLLRFYTDVNDNPPTLPQDNYEVTVSESAPFGSVILKVSAKDEDGPGEFQDKKYIFLLHFKTFPPF
jgi:hypothetical protein